jgi:hypothetical protein
MNEKLQYASMLEIPVSTCSVTYAPVKKKKAKKKKKIDHEQVKQELLTKINQDAEEQNAMAYADYDAEQDSEDERELSLEPVDETMETPKKATFKFSVVGLQLCIVGVLVAVIFLTNAFYPQSGINVFMRNVFDGETASVEKVDERTYQEFAPVIALSDGFTAVMQDGKISVSGVGSVYAPCNGKITSISKGEDGKFSIEVSHSENFKTVLKGLDYAYANQNDQVYFNIPVGYVKQGAVEMCFTDNTGAMITDYQLADGSVVWSV